MANNKLRILKIPENTIFIFIVIFVLVHGLFRQDSIIALISAVCGITYTFIAGKGNPVCYLFGITGSFFYSYLSFKNALWGNLLLYAGYYIPMQILGFFRWNSNLKENKKEIIKISLPEKDMKVLLLISVFGIVVCACILGYFRDSHPVLDSIATVLSIGGMYLTVRRAIQQWIFWMIVNALSLVMWLYVAFSGQRVWSTVIMWGVYFVLAVYFYICWKREVVINN